MAGDTVQEIKNKLSIQDALAPYMKLTRAGRSLRGLCPFHKEKTPSFHVSPERGTWHCFGCGLGGDAFSFVEKIEGVDFKGAMKILADKAGVQIEYVGAGASKEAASKQERMRAAMARAEQFYVSQLRGTAAEAYAKKRGLTDESISEWRLGYAPDAWRMLLESLTAEGFTTQELLAAGLIKEADGKPGTYYDRFRNRLMFPIRDAVGRVVAFTGRTLSADELAKYLNSPETDLFHKSEILFGMDVAKDAIRTRGYTMLVEGQMDVLLAHQAGFKNAIALSGTALTERHLGLMKRYSENLMLVLDADSAGLKATARSAALALHTGLRVKAAQLPMGKDPADLISEDHNEFAKRVAAAKPIVEFFLGELAQRETDPHRLLRTAEGIVLPLIAAMPSPMERDHFVQMAARVLGLSNEAVKESLRRLPAQPFAEGAAPRPLSQKAPARIPSELRSEQLIAVLHAYPDTPLAERIKSEYCRITEVPQLPTVTLPESALFYAEQTFGEGPSGDAADELLRAFEKAVIREAYQESVRNLRRAEGSGDASAIAGAQAICTKLAARMSAFGH
ncbi:MAG: DNA primase [bacterium]|nr:DNA primase [bacterium]